jgi:ADP-heptose:LPS heptosyltransferase/glycosyltransferase involved in cell wall biosynthesis
MNRFLFIRSYRRDLPWLKFSLRSLLKYASGFDGIVLACPWRDLVLFRRMIGREFGHIPALRIRPVRRMRHDYIGQQYTKLHADLFTGDDGTVTFWDSDAIATGPFDSGRLFQDGKILYLKTPYAALPPEVAEKWQPVTERWLGEPVSCEFMRRLPITFYASHLAELRRWFRQRHGQSLWEALEPLEGAAFSEFNLMGAWAQRHRPQAYRWLDTTEEAAAPLPCRQYWSLGGVTPEIAAEIAQVLGDRHPTTGTFVSYFSKPRRLGHALYRLRRWFLGDRHWMRLSKLRQYEPRPLRLAPPRRTKAGKELPSIALVTPSYNQAPFLEATLRSVLDQDYPALRFAVMDGGSQDGSVEIIERYRSRLAHAQSARDKGQADAIRGGFEHVSGEIMGWLNSDDVLLPGSLEAVGRYFAGHPEVDVVYSHRLIIDAAGDEIGRWIVPRHDPAAFRIVDWIPQETCFWRRRIWHRVGGIDPSFQFAMDWDLFLRFQAAGARFRRLPAFLGCFRVHEEQKTSSVYETVGAREVARLHQRELGREVARGEVDWTVRAATRRSVWRLRLFPFRLGRGRRIGLPRLAPVPRRAPMPDAAPARIIVIRSDAIGDHLLGTGLLAALRRKFPAARIAVACPETAAPVYDHSPDVDERIVFGGAALEEGAARDGLIGRIRSFAADWAINPHYSRGFFNDLLTVSSGAARRIGFDGDPHYASDPAYRRFTPQYSDLVSPAPGACNEAAFYRALCAMLDLPPGGLEPRLHLGADEAAEADAFFRERGLDPARTLALFAGTQSPQRSYLSYGKAMASLAELRGFTVIALGDESAGAWNAPNLADSGLPGIDLSGRTSLRQAFALLARCRLAVGSDTSLGHAASALGIPHVLLFGGGHFGRFVRLSPLAHIVALPLECYGCQWDCRFGNAPCVQAVSPHGIALAIADALAGPGPTARVYLQRTAPWTEGENLPRRAWNPAWLSEPFALKEF